jgi:hypothetical protein
MLKATYDGAASRSPIFFFYLWSLTISLVSLTSQEHTHGENWERLHNTGTHTSPRRIFALQFPPGETILATLFFCPHGCTRLIHLFGLNSSSTR